MKYPPVHYHDYLALDQILGSQNLRSEQLGTKAHDELLFITVHQTYELWFKQILWELESIYQLFSQTTVSENTLGQAVRRLERVRDIQRFINGQVEILETMTPLDFLDFRDYLYPASGFQSFQWRKIECFLGLTQSDRLTYSHSSFEKHLKLEQQEELKKILSQSSLFEVLEKWLERTPFLESDQFVFWQEYKKAVHNLLTEDLEVIEVNPRLSEDDKKRNRLQIQSAQDLFEALFDEDRYNELKSHSYFKFSLKAIRAILFIQIYRDEPILQMPFRLLQGLMDIDESMTEWRYKHSQMVYRMLGKKIGTGGSSGHDYLRAATEKHRIFSDLFNLSTFYIPRSQVPELPKDLTKKMSFLYNEKL